MLEKLSLTDEECERLAKGIATGAGLGTLMGILIENVQLSFVIGGVLGILITVIYSFYKRVKFNK